MTDDLSRQEPWTPTRYPPHIAARRAVLRGPLEIRSLALSGLFLLALGYTLYFARAVFLPIVLALFLNFLLRPVVGGLKHLHLPEAVGAAVVLVALLGVVGFGVYQLAEPTAEWMGRLPQSVRQLEAKLRAFKQSMHEVSQATAQLEAITQVGGAQTPPVVTVEVKRTGLTDVLFNTTLGLLAAAVVLLILLYFLLASGDLFLRKLVRLLPRLADKKLAVTIVRQVEADISRYLFTITLLYSGLGVAVGVAMGLLGMPNPVLWGVMAGTLSFIPYLGSLVGTVVLTGVALLSFEEVGRALVVPAVFVGLTALEGLVITPTIVGRRFTLNPVVIFVWLTCWGWMWGIPGTLLAFPMLATVKILCDHIKPLAPIGEVLGR
jgi:predicted PurR-regulated permease PerM